MFLAGLAWGAVFPINKNLWTSSYTVLMSGLAAVCLAICLWIVDVKGWKGWARPFEWLGVNAIALFVLSTLATLLMLWVKVTGDDGKKRSLVRGDLPDRLRPFRRPADRVAPLRAGVPARSGPRSSAFFTESGSSSRSDRAGGASPSPTSQRIPRNCRGRPCARPPLVVLRSSLHLGLENREGGALRVLHDGETARLGDVRRRNDDRAARATKPSSPPRPRRRP